MRHLIGLLSAIAILASCSQAAPTASPVASVIPIPSIGGSPIIPGKPVADVGDAFVATLEMRDGSYTGALQIEAVSPTGLRRSIASLADVAAGLPDGTTIDGTGPIQVSPNGLLTFSVEGPFGGVGADAVGRRIVVDLRSPDRDPVVVPAGSAAWGPDGRLAIVGAPGATFFDHASGRMVVGSGSDTTDISTMWAADGTGLLATRAVQDVAVAGVFTPDGRFIAGVRPGFSTTGLGRPYGVTGRILVDEVTDGADGSDHGIVEPRPGLGAPSGWLVVRQPGPDPDIFDHAWDAAGTGQWVTVGRDGDAHLVLLSGPGRSTDKARFRMTERPAIVGIAPDDSAVVVAMDATDASPAGLLWIDTTTGTTAHIDRAGGASFFAGWATAS